MLDTLRVTYEHLASEYYDAVRHPTCKNFSEASANLLGKWLQAFPISRGWLCEVGAGKSFVAEFLTQKSRTVDHLILMDSSPSMLAYSKQWASFGAHLVLSNAEMLPLASDSMELLVSSLGDPYNSKEFWNEAYRVLRRGGLSFFTTPSYDWAVAFRPRDDEEARMSAEFQLSDGARALVPSWIYSVSEQLRLIESSGLVVKSVAHVPLSALESERLSPKLLVGDADASVVTGFVAIKVQND
jgi:SAM-dependent methyltransferase